MGSVTAGHGHAARTHHAVLSPRGTLHYRERFQLRRLCQRGRTIADLERRRYLVRHLAAFHDVLAKGIPVRGCFAWSLIDNFEMRRRLYSPTRPRPRRLRETAAETQTEQRLAPRFPEAHT